MQIVICIHISIQKKENIPKNQFRIKSTFKIYELKIIIRLDVGEESGCKGLRKERWKSYFSNV